jgi:plasmid stabilization system protein ParE
MKSASGPPCSRGNPCRHSRLGANLGHKRPDLTSRPLRFTVVREYLIAYAPEEKPLWVVAVMHGRRSPRVMAAILRGRA